MKWKVLLFVSLFLFSFTAFAGETQPLDDPSCAPEEIKIYWNPNTKLYYINEADMEKNRDEGNPVKIICAPNIKIANGSRNGNGFFPERGDLCRSKCAPGQIVVGLALYTDEHEMLVENMSVICALPNLVDGWESIQSERGCGQVSYGGQAVPFSHRYQKVCDKGSYLKGVNAWIGSILDGIQLECAPINYEATTPQELFSNPGVLQETIYGLNENYRKDNGFPGIPASYQADLCDKGFFPVELDMWWKKFCWTPNTWGWDDEICYYSIVSGFRAVCGEASLGEEKKTHEIKIDPAGIPYGTSFPDNPEGRGDRCEAICNPGDILVGLEVHTGSLVDNIAVWCNNPNGGEPYKKGDCGGDGGVSHSLRCNQWEYVRSWKMRTGNAADSIQIECASLNLYASTIEEVLNGPGWWSWEYGINPSNSSTREDRGYPDAPPAPPPFRLCPDGGTLPSGLDVWHKRFCWANGRACYDDVVNGARAYCKKASVVVPSSSSGAIDLSQYFHRDDEVQLIDFVGTLDTDIQEDSETPSEENAPEDTETSSTGEQCSGQCSSDLPACPSGQIMNQCCTCVDPETTPPNNESNNGGSNDRGNVGSVGHSNQPDPSTDSNADSAPKSNSSKGGGGCSLNNNASFDPSLAVLFPIALFLLILRRRRLVCH